MARSVSLVSLLALLVRAGQWRVAAHDGSVALVSITENESTLTDRLLDRALLASSDRHADLRMDAATLGKPGKLATPVLAGLAPPFRLARRRAWIPCASTRAGRSQRIAEGDRRVGRIVLARSANDMPGAPSLSEPDACTALRTTKAWVEKVIVGLSLCPWAKPVKEEGGIRYVYTESKDYTELFPALQKEVEFLENSTLSSNRVETSIVVAPRAFPDRFQAFDTFVQFLDKFLRDRGGVEGGFQAVLFHPRFHIDGTAFDDPANYVNRSPYPMVHLLRQQSVQKALEASGDPQQRMEELWRTNAETLEEVGTAGLDELLKAACDEGQRAQAGSPEIL